MSSTALGQAVAAVMADADRPAELMDTAEHLSALKNIETLSRILPALTHEHLNELREHATAEEPGGSLRNVLADQLGIRRSDATRRLDEAADLGPRRTLTGESLPPKLEATAAAQQQGLIDGEHIKIIRSFLAQLPHFIDEPTKVDAEHKLAAVASAYRPDQLKRFADWYDGVLNPDGNFSDVDRARRRGITVGPQGADGMSSIRGWLNPEARAGWDAVAAKWAAPGMCNPADENPTVEGEPSQEDIDGDARSAAQRHHDAFTMMLRNTLMSGELGSHQGVPVTITVTAALEDLQAKAGVATTGGGTVLPINDVIRMAANAYNYLLIFDKARRIELYKGRTTRFATKEQRLVLYALERGCTRPGCDVPPYWCQVHHANKDWAKGGPTDIDNLTLACGPDNRLVDDEGWTTRKNDKGETEWIPPPHLDTGQSRTNTYWHSERMLPDEEEEDEDDADDEPDDATAS